MTDAFMKKLKKERFSDEVVDKLSRTFDVLGDPTRVRIIFALAKTELCVAEIAHLLEMTHSAISHQMRALKDLDLVQSRKEGRNVYYLLNDGHIENLFEEGLKHVLEKI